MQHFSFVHKNKSLRIDASLKLNMPNYSRNYLVSLIEGQRVSVNGIAVTKSSFKVKLYDQIAVDIPAIPAVVPQALDFEVIDEQRDFFIINKPAGVLTHPAATCRDTPSVAEAIINKIEFPEDYQGSNRAGIVHRLDKDTSGLLIIAKNPEGLNKFAEIFQGHKISKKYYAVCRGKPTQARTIIDKPIGRDPREGSKMRLYGLAPKNAYSIASLVQVFADQAGQEYSLMDVQILTGRTHQIRVHLASIGLPIIGDPVYGAPSKKMCRQALHAHYLEFEYDGKFFQYDRPLPSDMQALLDSLTPLR